MRQNDVSSGWEKTCEERGPGWREFMERQLPAWSPTQPHRYTVMEEFLYELAGTMDRVFESWQGRKLVLNTPTDNWGDHYRQMTDLLSLPPVDSCLLSFGDYVGCYRETQSGRKCVIDAVGNMLVLRGYFGPRRPLWINLYALGTPPIDHDCGTFEIPDTICVNVVFERNRQGTVSSIRVLDEKIVQSMGEIADDTCKGMVWLKERDCQEQSC